MFHKALERLPRGADHSITTHPFLRREYLEDSFIDRMFQEAFQPILEGEVDFLKFPQLALSIDFVFDSFEGAHVVALWRDPRPVFRSLVRREFPKEMIPASGLKAILLWNMYAYHIVNAADRHRDRVTVLSIDDFLNWRGVEGQLLTRIGRPRAKFVPVEQGVDLSLWNGSTPLVWRAYCALMSSLCSLANRRLGVGRAVLANQSRWVRSLRRSSWHPRTS